MVVRIRFGKGSQVSGAGGKNRRIALACAGLLTPAAVMALAPALWCMAARLQWTNSFAITSGLFSYWQVWLAAAAAIQLCAYGLNRYGNSGDPAAS